MNISIGIAMIISGMILLFSMVYFMFKGFEKTFKSDKIEMEAQDEAEHQPPPPKDDKWIIKKNNPKILKIT